MEENKVVIPTQQEVHGFNLASETTHDMIRQAQEADAADRRLTIREALRKYPKAVFWSMILSTSLIMEGYDVVVVSIVMFKRTLQSLSCTRSLPSTDKPSSAGSLVSTTLPSTST